MGDVELGGKRVPENVGVLRRSGCADEAHSLLYRRWHVGSRDANGQQVDDGDYTITAPGVLTFPTHASDFHYSGPTSVRYSIVGIELMFDVQVPLGCARDPACADAYGWALSAFFKGKAWTRS